MDSRWATSARLGAWKVVALTAVLGLGVLIAVSFSESGDRIAGGDSDELRGQIFRSAVVKRAGEAVALFDGVPIVVAFRDGEFSFRADCNSMGGKLRVGRSRLHVSDLVGTAIGCLREPARRDRFITSFFGDGPRWRLEGDELRLTRGDTSITFERDNLPPPLPRENEGRPIDLITGHFTMVYLQEHPEGLGGSIGGDFVDFDVRTRAGRTYLTLREDCERIKAPIQIKAATLSIGAAQSTTAGCDGEYERVPRLLLRFFDSEVMWDLANGELTLQRGRVTFGLQLDSHAVRRYAGLGRRPDPARRCPDGGCASHPDA